MFERTDKIQNRTVSRGSRIRTRIDEASSTKVSSPRKSLVKRDIEVVREEFKCKKCNHDKGIRYTGALSQNFNRVKCAKCGEFKK